MMLLDAVVVRVITKASIHCISAPRVIIIGWNPGTWIVQDHFFLSFERIHIHRLCDIVVLWVRILRFATHQVLCFSFNTISSSSNTLSCVELHNWIIDLNWIKQGIVNFTSLCRRHDRALPSWVIAQLFNFLRHYLFYKV